MRPWLLVTLAALAYGLAVVVAHGTPLALATPGAYLDPARYAGIEGYDGQFVYAIARDPSTAAAHLDAPAYRFQRILLPVVARVLALGQTALLPWVLLVVNAAALGAGTAILEGLLAERRASRWIALGYGLSVGGLGAARLSLPEPLAYALALGGIAAARRGRIVPAAVLFGLAALARETTLVLALGVGLWLLAERRWRDGAVFGILALAPFAAWQLVLAARLGEAGIGSGGAGATPFELVPFAGIARILTEGGPAVFVALGVLLVPFVLTPTLWGLARSLRDLARGAARLDSWLLLCAAGVMPFVPFSTYREPLGILRFILGLQIAVILHAAERRERRALVYSTLWAMPVLYVVASDFAVRG